MFDKKDITTDLVKKLIFKQFSQWKYLPIKEVAISGWDNRTFHLGKDMLVRLPSASEYAASVEKEQKWLPFLASQLKLQMPQLQIPAPLAMGYPDAGYPWNWSVYSYIEGETAAVALIKDMDEYTNEYMDPLAVDLAKFISALQSIDTTDGPLPDVKQFSHINGLSFYDNEVHKAVNILKDKIDCDVVIKIWESGLQTKWQNDPVWVHGDISATNILCKNGKLNAVIDFEGIAIGDPACDLVIAWKSFSVKSRSIFRANLSLDEDTWARGRAWALWKALIIAAGLTEHNIIEVKYAWKTLEQIMNDFVNK